MRVRVLAPIACLVALGLVLLESGSDEKPQTREQRVSERLASVQIPFVANSGQTDPAVAYHASTFAGTVFVTRDGQIVYSLPEARVLASGEQTTARKAGWALAETPVGAKVRPVGRQRAETQVSYFVGNDPRSWRTEIPTFEEVSLGEVWPGINLELRAHGANVEKIFTVEPHGDPSAIRMSLAGAESLRVNEAGALVVGTGVGEVTFTPPEAFQEIEGVQRSISVAYQLEGQEYGFRLGSYDSALPVMIDPLLQATYLGSNQDDIAQALAIHPITADVYVAGYTLSTAFPGTSGGAQAAPGGGSDAFVARLNAALTTLHGATYLGGGGSDAANALAIHPMTGEVYAAGYTVSSDFPQTGGGAQAVAGGSVDAFVTRLNGALTTLGQTTYLGGSGYDASWALAVHPTTGDVYAAGNTQSADFPERAGGAQPAYGGGSFDGYCARFNAALTTLDQATYVGGSSEEYALALSIHPTMGDVYVAGFTVSPNFPGTATGAQATFGGYQDGFVGRLNPALTSLYGSTYLGGGDLEVARALAIHPLTGDVYAAGVTLSTNFPGTSGGTQATSGGGQDAFIGRLDAALTTLNQSTYLGAGGDDYAYALAVHPTTGEVYVAGRTSSTTFPGTSGGAQAAFGGHQDAFVGRLNPSLTTLGQSTYLGGSDAELLNALAINSTTGDVYVDGYTYSQNFPGTAGGAQAGFAGVNDAFVARLSADLAVTSPTNTPTRTPTNTPTDSPTDPPTLTETPADTPTPTPTPTATAIPDLQGPVTSDTSAHPNPAPINTSIRVTAAVSDATTGGANIASAEYRIGTGSYLPMSASDGSFDGSTEDVEATIPGISSAGVYEICVRGQDSAGNVGPDDCTFLAVYDASGGFVTGGGWIDSPAGAYGAEAMLTGKANFGFVSKYQKSNSTVPTGETQFHFSAAGLRFDSDSYEWLVISGAKARYRGTGSVDGTSGYGFELTAWDGQVNGGGGVDRFRIKIWLGNPGNVIYDNERASPDGADPVTEVQGGNIVIHKK